MSKNRSVEFPPLDCVYTGEFGQVDIEIYGLAREVWFASGEKMAVNMLNDAPQGLRLMMKAIAKVGEALQDPGNGIRYKKAYLRKTYKNLLLAEVEKQAGRNRILAGASAAAEHDPAKSEEALNRKILIHQICREMSDWTRAVFNLHQMGYSFEEMVPKYGSAANAIRSRYSKEMAKLARKFEAELKRSESGKLVLFFAASLFLEYLIF